MVRLISAIEPIHSCGGKVIHTGQTIDDYAIIYSPMYTQDLELIHKPVLSCIYNYSIHCMEEEAKMKRRSEVALAR